MFTSAEFLVAITEVSNMFETAAISRRQIALKSRLAYTRDFRAIFNASLSAAKVVLGSATKLA